MRATVLVCETTIRKSIKIGTSSQLIDCIHFCRAFELALSGHDETEPSNNPDVFRGLAYFVTSLDTITQKHLEHATVSKGTSKTIQNTLLGRMLDVMQGHIIGDLKASAFRSVQCDETTDISTQCPLVAVFRYIDPANTVQDRLFLVLKRHECRLDL